MFKFYTRSGSDVRGNLVDSKVIVIKFQCSFNSSHSLQTYQSVVWFRWTWM
eukprot:m.141823 g.141823  ORF g.141823 m.141823 type:complete len:51 (-) comp14044_c0_seq1:2221-2373(-)